jgi:hypothetical protein
MYFRKFHRQHQCIFQIVWCLGVLLVCRVKYLYFSKRSEQNTFTGSFVYNDGYYDLPEYWIFFLKIAVCEGKFFLNCKYVRGRIMKILEKETFITLSGIAAYIQNLSNKSGIAI